MVDKNFIEACYLDEIDYKEFFGKMPIRYCLAALKVIECMNEKIELKYCTFFDHPAPVVISSFELLAGRVFELNWNKDYFYLNIDFYKTEVGKGPYGNKGEVEWFLKNKFKGIHAGGDIDGGYERKMENFPNDAFLKSVDEFLKNSDGLMNSGNFAY